METQEGIDALFLYATEGILVVNDTGEIIRINPSAEDLFGYDRNELVGKKIEALVPHRFSERHTGYRVKFGDNPRARSMGAGMELYALKKDGQEIQVEISLSPYSSEGEKFVIVFIIDITTRRQAEEKLRNYSIELEKQVRNRTLILEDAIIELEKTKKDLHTALEKERELNQMKSRFVSMASHEFRTPLTTMMTSLSLVTKFGEQEDKENQDKYISKIRSSIKNLTDILNDFLSVSKLEEGKVLHTPEYFDICHMCQEIITEMQTLAMHGQQLVHNHEGDHHVILDKKLLTNILINLLSNAIKFSPDGGDIEVNVCTSNTEVEVVVKDHGMGIAKEDQKHLFERFFRGQNATYIQGTGLGLNIVARYTDLMEGKLSITSKEHEGTSICLLFPQPDKPPMT